MKKLIMTVLAGITLVAGVSTAGATSKYGVSANMVKNNFTSKDKVATVYVKNDDNYEIGTDMQPQKLVKGKWVDLEWYMPMIIEKHQKESLGASLKYDFKNKGTYRYKVTVCKFDKKGNEVTQGKFYTGNFNIK